MTKKTMPPLYYQLKGLISEMTPEQQQEIDVARQEIIAIATRSEFAVLGMGLAGLEIDAMET